ncbi:MAG: YbfB/YjiJ family MFS transporter [Rhodospirillales bacterium]|nr:YbfB/YjiJ family MFS transporter [Rhodospirillales bacterium]
MSSIAAPPTATTATDREAAKVMAAGIASMVLTVGLARFLYTPLLPVMQEQAHLSVTGGGWLATINYAGYMTGTLLIAAIGDLRTRFLFYRALLVIAVITTAAMGLTTSLVAWAVLRFFAGMTAVGALLLGTGLMLAWLRHHGRRLELGVPFGGLGLGIVVSGLLPMAMAFRLDWAGEWIASGLFGIVFLIPAWIWMPMPPQADAAGPAALADTPPVARWMALFVAAYFCAGVGYVVSATFIVALVAHLPALRGMGNLVWVVVGLGAIPTAPLWDRVARRTGDIRALLAAFALLTLSIAIGATTRGVALSLVGAALYGCSFNGITSMTLTIIGRLYPRNPSKAMARMTISFGAAQIIAPAVSGYIAALTGSYDGALWMAAAVMVTGMACLLLLPRQRTQAAAEAAA